MRIVRIFDNLNLLAKAAADFVYREMLTQLERAREVSFIISGNLEFPLFYHNFKKLFNSTHLLKIDIYWFLANENWAAPGSSLNLEQQLRENLFNAIRPPEENIFSWKVLYQPPFQCAARLNTSIENFFIQTGKKPSITLLVMNKDGNIAALYPGSSTLEQEIRSRPLAPEIKQYSLPVYYKENWHMSLSPALINQSEIIIVFILGKDKQLAWKRYLDRQDDLSLSWIKGKRIYFYMTRETAGDFIYNYTKKALKNSD